MPLKVERKQHTANIDKLDRKRGTCLKKSQGNSTRRQVVNLDSKFAFFNVLGGLGRVKKCQDKNSELLTNKDQVLSTFK
jgi:hypothetical protein